MNRKIMDRRNDFTFKGSLINNRQTRDNITTTDFLVDCVTYTDFTYLLPRYMYLQ